MTHPVFNRSVVCSSSAVFLTVDGADLVARGEADQLVAGVVHDEDLVDAELLARRRSAQDLLVWTALELDALRPDVAVCASATVRHANGVIPPRRGRDHCEEKIED